MNVEAKPLREMPLTGMNNLRKDEQDGLRSC